MPFGRGYRAGMGAQAAAGAGRGVDYRPELVEPNGFFIKGAFVITGTAEGGAEPGGAMKMVDHRQSHSRVLLLNMLQAAGGTDFNAFHAEIAGDFLHFDYGCSGMETGTDIEHCNRSIRADLDASAAADAFGGKDFFNNSAGRPQPIGGNRRPEYRSPDRSGQQRQREQPRSQQAEKLPAFHRSRFRG